jgi:peptide/nickel transport system permease protein
MLITGRSLFNLCVIMGITSWTGLCRLLRGEALKLREQDYVRAAKASGLGSARIMARHLLPNVMHVVLIVFILRFSGLVLSEAVLTYLGIGVDAGTGSWGRMVDISRAELTREPLVWWNLAAAFGFMFGLVLPLNLFGDALRDALDPKLRS